MTDIRKQLETHIATLPPERLQAAMRQWISTSPDFAITELEQVLESEYQDWLEREVLSAGEEILPEAFDADNLDAFWQDIDTLSDQMVSGDVEIRDDSAALPL